MPSYDNVEKFAQRIVNCNKELDALFNKLQKSSEFHRQLQQIKTFYAHNFNRTTDEDSGDLLVRQFEQFVVTVSEVKLGQLTADEALEIIQDSTEERQSSIVVHNILKVCELLFWTAVAVSSYIACVTVGVPLFFLQPILGIAVTAGTAILFLTSLDYAGSCFEEFKSCDRINEEHTREKNAISFFSPPPCKIPANETLVEKQTETADLSPNMACG